MEFLESEKNFHTSSRILFLNLIFLVSRFCASRISHFMWFIISWKKVLSHQFYMRMREGICEFFLVAQFSRENVIWKIFYFFSFEHTQLLHGNFWFILPFAFPHIYSNWVHLEPIKTNFFSEFTFSMLKRRKIVRKIVENSTKAPRIYNSACLCYLHNIVIEVSI